MIASIAAHKVLVSPSLSDSSQTRGRVRVPLVDPASTKRRVKAEAVYAYPLLTQLRQNGWYIHIGQLHLHSEIDRTFVRGQTDEPSSQLCRTNYLFRMIPLLCIYMLVLTGTATIHNLIKWRWGGVEDDISLRFMVPNTLVFWRVQFQGCDDFFFHPTIFSRSTILTVNDCGASRSRPLRRLLRRANYTSAPCGWEKSIKRDHIIHVEDQVRVGSGGESKQGPGLFSRFSWRIFPEPCLSTT